MKLSRSTARHQPTPFKVANVASPQNPYQPNPQKTGGVTQSMRNMNFQALPLLKETSQVDPETSKLSRTSSRVSRSSCRDVSMERNESIFDQFLISTSNMPLHKCVEDVIMTVLNAKEVTFWQDIPSLHVLISQKLGKTVNHSEALVGFTFYQRNRIVLEKPYSHPAYSEKVDRCGEDKHLMMLLFPLWDNVGSLCAVVQVKRQTNNPFNLKPEFDFVDYFSKKFSIFYKLYFHPTFPDQIMIELLQFMEIEQFLLLFQKKMDMLFKCRCAEIWRFNFQTNILEMYKKNKIQIDIGNSGIIGEAISTRYPINCTSNRMMSSYNEMIDGVDVEPVIAIPVVNIKQNMLHIVCLRGGNRVAAFTTEDEAVLTKMTPYIILALTNIENLYKNTSFPAFDPEAISSSFIINSNNELINGNNDNNNYKKSKLLCGIEDDNSINNNNNRKINNNGCKANLTSNKSCMNINMDRKDVREKQCLDGFNEAIDNIKSKVIISDTLSHIIDKMELIAHSDRTTLYTLDKESLQLKTFFCTGKNVPIVKPASQSIPGLVISTGQMYNIADAENDLEFDASIDMETNYKTKTILAIPVFNSTMNEPIGVVEFLNRIDGKPFPHSDITYLNVLSLLIGLLLDNKSLKDCISNNEQKMRDFLDISLSMMSDKVLQKFLKNILSNIAKTIGCDRSALYLLSDNKENLVSFVNAGKFPLQQSLPLSMGIAAMSIRNKDIMISNDAKNDTRIVKDPLDLSGIILNSVLVAPIITADGDCIGLVEVADKNKSNDLTNCMNRYNSNNFPNEMNRENNNSINNSCNKDVFTQEDICLMRSYTLLASICMEERQMSAISDRGNVEFEMNRWIETTERFEYTTPENLKIVTTKKIDIESSRFFSLQFEENGIDLFKVVFLIFQDFNFFSLYKINAETLFSFLYSLREIYPEKNLYHNFTRAVDVLQFVSYQIRISKIENRLTHHELFALCITALIFDINYNKFQLNNLAEQQNLENENKSEEDVFNELLHLYNIDINNKNYYICTHNSDSENNNEIISNEDEMEKEILERKLSIKRLSKLLVLLGKNRRINIFKNIQLADLKLIWKWIFRLTNGTDMSNHFRIIMKVKEHMKGRDEVDWSNEDMRLLASTMIIKSAMVSFMCRSQQNCETLYSRVKMEVSPEWFTSVYAETDRFERGEELFPPMTNDLSPSSTSVNLVPTSVLMKIQKRKIDRKLRDQIGFADIIALPTLKATSQMIHSLYQNYEFAEANYDKWRAHFFDPDQISKSGVM